MSRKTIFRQQGFRKETIYDIERLETLQSLMSKRKASQYSTKSTSKRPMFKRPRTNKRSDALKAKIGAIEHKFYNSSVTGIAISQDPTFTGSLIDPTTSMFAPVTGDDFENREGRQCMVDEIHVKGIVVFAGAEDVINTPCGQQVFISLIQDNQTNAVVPAATGSGVYTNTTGSLLGLTSPHRNPNNIKKYTTIRTTLLNKPMPPITQTGANLYSWPSYSMPFEFYHKFKKPVQVRFNANNAGVIADIIDNSWHIIAVTGGDTLGTLTSRMDCNMTYNCRVRFYG